MAKTKVRPHPGALTELLKSRGITLTDAARDISRGTPVIDRKTLARIDRGDEVKLETLQKLANNLKVPTSYFDPPVGSSVDQADSQLELEEKGWLSLLLHKVDVDDLLRMIWKIFGHDNIHWELNVQRVDDEAISLLEQFEDAVKDVHDYLNAAGPDSLRRQLDQLKRTKNLASLLEELAKHRLAILGNSYLNWGSLNGIDAETDCPYVNYTSEDHVLFSVEGHPAHERRVKVWQGTVPPKFAPLGKIVKVNDRMLEMDPAVLAQAVDEAMCLNVEGEPTVSNSRASSEDSNA